MVVSMSIGLVGNALRSSKFKSEFPEFNGLATQPATGCPGCGTRRKQVVDPTKMSVFLRVMESLPVSKLASFKKYFNAGSLQYRLNNEVRTL